jgi:hypothetical protein
MDIYKFLKNNIKYDKSGNFDDALNISNKLAYEMGFTAQVGNIIHNSFLLVTPLGDSVKDASKVKARIQESIWIKNG